MLREDVEGKGRTQWLRVGVHGSLNPTGMGDRVMFNKPDGIAVVYA